MKDYLTDCMAALEQAQAIAEQRGDESEAYGIQSALSILRAYGGGYRVKSGAPIELKGDTARKKPRD
ncbi:hypothetical protein M3557_04300 [Bhargavaea ginsengi]|uniref:hypothetical protein n=1 Tax=Bhargavaea ginsengi TaxID=426757 RepID=UPI00203ACF74|nr:hypothetical protein [Bhargavaea ginsengi]MCM3087129.1 hypothetical protein [Bhargavaea ginsengi]